MDGVLDWEKSEESGAKLEFREEFADRVNAEIRGVRRFAGLHADQDGDEP